MDGNGGVGMPTSKQNSREAVKKIVRSTGMTGIMVVPVWRTAVFWPFIVPDGRHVTECFGRVEAFRPYLLQGETGDGNQLMK